MVRVSITITLPYPAAKRGIPSHSPPQMGTANKVGSRHAFNISSLCVEMRHTGPFILGRLYAADALKSSRADWLAGERVPAMTQQQRAG